MNGDHRDAVCHFKLLGTSVRLINSRAVMRSIRDRETNRDLNLTVAGATRETSSFKVIINHAAFSISIVHLVKQNR